MGNERANSFWEAELPHNYDRVGIENFIRAKYVLWWLMTYRAVISSSHSAIAFAINCLLSLMLYMLQV